MNEGEVKPEAEVESGAIFTPEEEKEFTLCNAAAFDLIMLKARRTKSIPPCWLCMSEDAKEKARQDLYKMLEGNGVKVASVKEFDERFGSIPQGLEAMGRWKRVELQMKNLRTQGNPRAYFYGGI